MVLCHPGIPRLSGLGPPPYADDLIHSSGTGLFLLDWVRAGIMAMGGAGRGDDVEPETVYLVPVNAA